MGFVISQRVKPPGKFKGKLIGIWTFGKNAQRIKGLRRNP